MTSSFLSKRDANYKYAKMLLNSVDNMFNLTKRAVFYIKMIIEAQQKDVPIYLICGIQTTSGSAFIHLT